MPKNDLQGYENFEGQFLVEKSLLFNRLSTMENKEKTISDEIFAITTKIQKEFPELYKILMETPLANSYKEEDTSYDSLVEYLESIKIQLAHFQELKLIRKGD